MGLENKEKGICYTAKEANAKGFYFRINGNNCKIMSYRGSETKVTIPAFINGKPVRQIGTRAFARKKLKDVQLPETLYVIRTEAFAQNYQLKSIMLPGNIKRIEDSAFIDCTKLREIHIKTYAMDILSERQIDVTYHAFEGTPYITAMQYVILDNILLRVNLNEESFLKIPAGVREIKADACQTIWNFSVKKVILPVSVRRIGNRAFADLSGLQTVLLEKGREKEYCISVGANVFRDCTHYNLLGRGGNREYIPSLCNQAIAGDNRQTNGWISFNEKLRCVDDRKRVERSYYGPSDIYVPFLEYNEFWRMMHVEFVWGIHEFMLTLRWSDYQQFYEDVDSLYDQIEMAVCLIQNTSTYESPLQMQFLTEHINKAVKFALKKNQKERLIFYQTNQLLLPERGLNVRKITAYIEKYQNDAAMYLTEVLKNL